MGIQAQRILQRRKLLGLSQEELALRVGTSQRQISKYETGKNDPTSSVLGALAVELGTTPNYLLGITDNPEAALDVADLDELEQELIAILRGQQRDMRERILRAVKGFV